MCWAQFRRLRVSAPRTGARPILHALCGPACDIQGGSKSRQALIDIQMALKLMVMYTIFTAFHEAVGEMVTLAVTNPDHLQRLGLFPGNKTDDEGTLL